MKKLIVAVFAASTIICAFAQEQENAKTKDRTDILTVIQRFAPMALGTSEDGGRWETISEMVNATNRARDEGRVVTSYFVGPSGKFRKVETKVSDQAEPRSTNWTKAGFYVNVPSFSLAALDKSETFQMGAILIETFPDVFARSTIRRFDPAGNLVAAVSLPFVTPRAQFQFLFDASRGTERLFAMNTSDNEITVKVETITAEAIFSTKLVVRSGASVFDSLENIFGATKAKLANGTLTVSTDTDSLAAFLIRDTNGVLTATDAMGGNQ